MNPVYNSKHIADAIEAKGNRVFRISCDKNTENIVADEFPFNYLTNTEKIYTIQRRFVHKAINYIPSWVDEIICFQSDFIFDFTGINKPVHYIISEILENNIPLNADIKSLFYAYDGAVEYYRYSHPQIFQNNPYDEFLTYAANESMVGKPQFDNKINKICCRGSTYLMGGITSRHYLIRHIYDDRNKYIQYLQQTMPQYFEYQDRTGWYEYIEYIKKFKFILNVPGIAGIYNDRLFHAPLAGTILVQKYYKDLEHLGFKDMETCIFFDSEEELLQKMMIVLQDNEICNKIQKQAYELVKSKHTFQNRADQLYSALQRLGEN